MCKNAVMRLWLYGVASLFLGHGVCIAHLVEKAPSAYTAGVAAAHALAPGIPKGKGIVVLRTHIDAYDSESAETGFIQTCITRYPHIPLLSTDFHSGNTLTSARRIASGLLKTYADDLGGVFAASERPAEGLAWARAQNNAPLAMSAFIRNQAAADAFATSHPDTRIFTTDAPPLTQTDTSFLNAQTPFPKTPIPEGLQTRSLLRGQINLVQLPQGFVYLDKDRTQPIAVAGFSIGQFEITQAQWQAVMGNNPSVFADPERPVDNISWENADLFCKKLTALARQEGSLNESETINLPSRAQWIYAALANAQEPTGADLDAQAWHRGTSGQPVIQEKESMRLMSTHPVGTRAPNPFGLFDIYGNVQEWCADTYIPAEDQRKKTTLHALQGGSWWADPQACSAYHTHRAPATRHHSALGLRIVINKNSPETPTPKPQVPFGSESGNKVPINR